MSRRGNCWDIAVAESLFQLAQEGEDQEAHSSDRDEARSDVFDQIEMFCNPRRRHSHLSDVNPEAYEASNHARQVSPTPGEVQPPRPTQRLNLTLRFSGDA